MRILDTVALLRARVFAFSLLLIIGCSTPSTSPPAPPLTAVETITQAILPSIMTLPQRTVAVLPFTDVQATRSQPTPQAQLLAERITTSLVTTPHVHVVERSQLTQLTDELTLNANGLVDDQTAKAIGKFLSADAILTGTLTTLGSDTEIHARLIRVEDGVILTAITTRARLPLPAPNGPTFTPLRTPSP